jgi:5-methylcytosine-specific restriction protein A
VTTFSRLTACLTCAQAPCQCDKSPASPEAKGTPLSKYDKRPWHKLYNLTRWKNDLRPAVLRKFPICTVCNRAPATIAHHIRDHKGILSLFFDFTNLTGLCKPCHDAIGESKTTTGSGNPSNDRPGIDANGLVRDYQTHP